MRLAELLRLHQPETLRDILHALDEKPSRKLDREALVEAISSLLLDGGTLREILISLRDNERLVLYWLLFCLDDLQFDSHTENVRGFVLISTRSKDSGFVGLNRHGILHRFVHPFRPDTERYVLPEDLVETICVVLAQEIIDQYFVSISEKQSREGTYPDPLTRDLLALLLVASSGPIRYTREHVPYRTTINQLDALLPRTDLMDEVLIDPYWRPDRYPSLQMETLFHFAEKEGLLRQTESGYTIAPDAFQQLRISFSHKYSHWMGVSLFGARSRILMRRLMAVLIREWPDGKGLDAGKLLGWSDPFALNDGFRFERTTVEWVSGYFVKSILAGVLTVVRRTRGRPLLIRTPLGRSLFPGEDAPKVEEKRIFVVQPDFEMIADPLSLSEAGETVAPFVDPVSVDQAFVLRLSRESVRRGLRQGHSVSLFRQGLERAVTRNIPDNVLASIEEWGKKYSRIRLRSVLLIDAENTEHAELIERSRVAKYITDRIAPTVFCARLDDLSKIRRSLKKLRVDVVDEVLAEAERAEIFQPDIGRGMWQEVPKPETDPLQTFAEMGDALRQDLMSYEIVPFGAGVEVRRIRRRTVRPEESMSPSEIRTVVAEALRSDKPLRIVLATETGRRTHVVEPIYWDSGRGRYGFYGRDRGGMERVWMLSEIVTAHVIGEDSAD